MGVGVKVRVGVAVAVGVVIGGGGTGVFVAVAVGVGVGVAVSVAGAMVRSSVAVPDTCPKLLVERVPKVCSPSATGDAGVKVYGSLSSSKAPSVGTTPLLVKVPPSRLHPAPATLETVTADGVR